MEGTKRCKCCGVEKEVSEFDLSNTKKPISLCKPCRRVQQQINNLSKLKTLTEAQSAKLKAAREYMMQCEASTGFVTGGYCSRVGAVSTKMQIATAELSHTVLRQKYKEAQELRAKKEAAGVLQVPPTLDILENFSVSELINQGYRVDELYAVLESEVNKELPLYAELEDKLMPYPR